MVLRAGVLRAGVVGAGVMGANHARNLASLPDVRLVAVADPDLERARTLAAAPGVAGLGVEALADPELLFERVDLVVIASPASSHARLARAALLAGLHTLVEKPLATTLPEAESLLELARDRGLVLQGGQLLRFHGGVERLSAGVKAPNRLVARRVGRARRVQDVGVILDLLIHDLDLTLLLLGEEPSAVRASGYGAPGHEDHVEVELSFPSGASARLTAGRDSERTERTLELRSAAGAARLDFADHPDENPLLAQLRHFVDCARGAAPRFPVEQDLRALALALRVREALNPGVDPGGERPSVAAELPAAQ